MTKPTCAGCHQSFEPSRADVITCSDRCKKRLHRLVGRWRRDLSRLCPNRDNAIIYADPAWKFRTYSRKGQGRSPDAHYETLHVEAIKRLPVAEFAAPDAALFLWVYTPMLEEGMNVLRAWGFRYVSIAFVWGKVTKHPPVRPQTGTGYWTRHGAEICLLGTRGRPRRVGAGVRQLDIADLVSDTPHLELAARGPHSWKPPRFRDRIIELCGDQPRLELFSRSDDTEARGWRHYGDQVGLLAGSVVDQSKIIQAGRDAA